MRDELLQMMVKFQLCYPIPDRQDTYIVPQLLTREQPDYAWDEVDNLLLRYSYDFMPKGIVWQFMVVMHRFIGDQECAWRGGVVLEADQTQAEVIEKYGLRRIEIRVSGQNKRDLLTRVRHELEKIHHQYPGLKYNELIPSKCDTCRDSQEPYFYKFESLRRRLAAGVYEVECDISYQKVKVRSLIDDIGGQVEGANPQRVEYLQSLIALNERRLQELEKQKAKMGFHTPPHIKTEIENTKTEIEQLQSELGGLP
jgi:hypothetical protein